MNRWVLGKSLLGSRTLEHVARVLGEENVPCAAFAWLKRFRWFFLLRAGVVGDVIVNQATRNAEMRFKNTVFDSVLGLSECQTLGKMLLFFSHGAF